MRSTLRRLAAAAVLGLLVAAGVRQRRRPPGGRPRQGHLQGPAGEQGANPLPDRRPPDGHGPDQNGTYRIDHLGGVPVGSGKVEIEGFEDTGKVVFTGPTGQKVEEASQVLPAKYNTQPTEGRGDGRRAEREELRPHAVARLRGPAARPGSGAAGPLLSPPRAPPMLVDIHTNLFWYPDHLSDEFVDASWAAKRAKMRLTGRRPLRRHRHVVPAQLRLPAGAAARGDEGVRQGRRVRHRRPVHRDHRVAGDRRRVLPRARRPVPGLVFGRSRTGRTAVERLRYCVDRPRPARAEARPDLPELRPVGPEAPAAVQGGRAAGHPDQLAPGDVVRPRPGRSSTATRSCSKTSPSRARTCG